MEEQARFEGVGENFDLRMMMLTRQKTQEAIQRIAAAIKPGMAEEAAHEWARTVLREAGLLRGWHGIQLRFGPNTLKPFGAPSEPGVVLQDNDIFFIDIGPVWDKWEGDGGATFVVGNDPDMLRIARDVQEVFARVRRKWLTERVSGRALYQYAGEEARSLGWELNLKMAGHRLADFPHAAIHKGSLADAAFAPSSSLWVLEIQIRHPERPFSAFYEDLLLAD
ncbi:MAG TPA: M24 family metallopeptidase [Steroidobacteraceae bacterium]|nr:M24 family metallopeptidase [Steroidobacteraceae bacterium]